MPTIADSRAVRLPKQSNVVSRIVCAIGKGAGVVVNRVDGRFASVHYLWRTFGARWSREANLMTLKLLMRHRQDETTMRNYIDQNADKVAEGVFEPKCGPVVCISTLDTCIRFQVGHSEGCETTEFASPAMARPKLKSSSYDLCIRILVDLSTQRRF